MFYSEKTGFALIADSYYGYNSGRGDWVPMKQARLMAAKEITEPRGSLEDAEGDLDFLPPGNMWFSAMGFPITRRTLRTAIKIMREVTCSTND